MKNKNKYETAIKIWIARQVSNQYYHIDAEMIEDVKFGDDNHGFCETCDDPYWGIAYKLKGKKDWHTIDFRSYTPVEIVSECMEIYNETLRYM